MTEFKVLSVAEENYESDCISAKWYSYDNRYGHQQLRISVNKDRKLVLEDDRNALCFDQFTVHTIDSLIQYLQDAKTFLSEEDMIAKLMGKRANDR